MHGSMSWTGANVDAQKWDHIFLSISLAIWNIYLAVSTVKECHACKLFSCFTDLTWQIYNEATLMYSICSWPYPDVIEKVYVQVKESKVSSLFVCVQAQMLPKHKLVIDARISFLLCYIRIITQHHALYIIVIVMWYRG